MTTHPETTSADEFRARMHGMWGTVAPAWGEHAEYVDARVAVVTDRMLELADLQEGEQVLELACGAGGLGLAAAARVGDSGRVILSDVAGEMTALAQKRAAGLDNVETRVLDLEQIDEPDASYDAVLCREGLMFALDPATAAREIHRVLRPGGRVVVAVWGPRQRNPWLGLVLDCASAQLGAPVPPPGMPGPFALEDSERLATVLAAGQLESIRIEELPVSTEAGAFDEWWNRTCSLAGPLASMLASLPPEAAEKLRARALEAAQAFRTDRGYEFPGVTLVATARRPEK
jgi:enediyne biosynthesis protein CalE5